MADNFQNLLDLLDESWVVNRLGQLNVPKVARTFGHVLIASGALELTVDGTQSGIVESSIARLHLALIHRLRV